MFVRAGTLDWPGHRDSRAGHGDSEGSRFESVIWSQHSLPCWPRHGHRQAQGLYKKKIGMWSWNTMQNVDKYILVCGHMYSSMRKWQGKRLPCVAKCKKDWWKASASTEAFAWHEVSDCSSVRREGRHSSRTCRQNQLRKALPRGIMTQIWLLVILVSYMTLV